MNKNNAIDVLGLGLYFAIVIFGVANIYSVNADSGLKQATWLVISCILGFFIFALRTKFFENMGVVFYIIGVILLIGIFPFGKEINGAKAWYKLGSISLQPVEFVKTAISLMIANFASGQDFNIKQKRSIYGVLIILGLPAILILLQPDVGSLMVFTAFVIALFREGLSGWLFVIGFSLAGIFLFSLAYPPYYIIATLTGLSLLLIWIYRFKFACNHRYFFVLGGLLVLLSGLSYVSPLILNNLPKHQRERIEVLFKGEKAFRDTAGYNLLYSKTAIGSGGFWGKGYREGSVTQGAFVPEQRTDYIFCTVGEEWGYVGSVMLVIAYISFIIRVYYLAEQHKNTFSRVFGYCFASILLMHFSMNIGMVVGLFPTVGVPLPYFSYGGSSLLAFSIMTFIFFKLNYADRNSLL